MTNVLLATNMPAELPFTPRQHRLMRAGAEILDHPEEQELAFITKYLVQATMPHRQPRNSPPIWYRSNGEFTLSIKPGYVMNAQTHQMESLGYPAGSIPRLLMFWIGTEVKRTKSRRLELGNSLAAFMKELGLNHRNGGPGSKRSDRHRLQREMQRLFRATISFDYSNLNVDRWLDMQIAPNGELWWNLTEPKQASILPSWIELGEAFYEAISHSQIPLDMRALRQLKNSPLALDLYAWAAHRTYYVTHQRHRPMAISWQQLKRQCGAEYSSEKNFRQRAKAALAKVRCVYPGLKLEEIRGRLIVHPGDTAITRKSVRL